MARTNTRIDVRDTRTADVVIIALGNLKDTLQKRLSFRGGLPGDRADLRRVKSLIHQTAKINRELNRNNSR